MLSNRYVVSINILNYNTYEKTKKCIESCLKQKGIKYRILLIDNNSEDASFERLVAEYGEAIDFLRNDYNYGYAKGNNLAIRFCLEKGIEYSLILNSDTELVGELLLKNLVDVIKDNKRCGVVAPYIYDVTAQGLILNKNDAPYLKMLRLFRVLPQNRTLNSELDTLSEAQGSALLVDNKLFNQVGGFPEHYFMYGEEGTFAKKVLWSNRLVLWYKNRNTYVLHHHDKTKIIDKWRVYLMGRNRALEYYENRDRHLLSWRIVYTVFHLKMLLEGLKQKDNIYMLGMKAAKKMYKKATSKETYFIDGKNAKEEYSN